EIQGGALIFRRNLIAGFKPAVDILASPDIAGLHGFEQGVVRNIVKLLFGLISADRQFTNLFKNHMIQSILKALELSKHTQNLLVIQHSLFLFSSYILRAG